MEMIAIERENAVLQGRLDEKRVIMEMFAESRVPKTYAQAAVQYRDKCNTAA